MLKEGNDGRIVRIFIEARLGREGWPAEPFSINLAGYMAHGVMLASNKKPLLAEPVFAWEKGFAIESLVAKRLSGRLSGPEIARMQSDLDVQSAIEVAFQMFTPWDTEGAYARLCKKGTPPFEAWRSAKRPSNELVSIDNSVIGKYFRRLRVLQTPKKGAEP